MKAWLKRYDLYLVIGFVIMLGYSPILLAYLFVDDRVDRPSIMEEVQPSFWGATFRSLNFIGPIYPRPSKYDDDGYKPYDDEQIVGGEYDEYYEQFQDVFNSEYAAHLKTDIDQERADKRVIARALTPDVRNAFAAGVGLIIALLFAVRVFRKRERLLSVAWTATFLIVAVPFFYLFLTIFIVLPFSGKLEERSLGELFALTLILSAAALSAALVANTLKQRVGAWLARGAAWLEA